jgi:hypothetical protein
VTEFPRKCIRLLYEGHKRHDTPVTRSTVAAPPWPRTTRGIWKGKLRIIGDIVNVDFSDLWEAAR